MLNRIIGVFKLDVNTFEEIEHDQNATGQAALIVLVIGLLSGIGQGIVGDSFVSGLIVGLLSTLAGWVIWSAVTYFVGTSLFKGQADMGEMLRVIGFAYSPQILGIIPCLGQVIGAIWTLVAGFVAVRQGLDLDNTKAALTIGIGFVAYLVIFFIIGLFLGGAGLALNAITG
ncbi:MAG: hypothetical protein D6706_15800 [Chloroflexi bacterium]|nr:MAG: hypothetical protein D6706_15800 [Chloroflexota bacterium]